jgi:hypothetical protein
MILFLTCVPILHEERIVQAQNSLDSPKNMTPWWEFVRKKLAITRSSTVTARRPAAPPVVPFEHEI